MSDDMPDDLGALKNATETGTRTDTTENEKSLIEQYAELCEDIEGSRGSRVLTTNAPTLWILFQVLDDNPEKRSELLTAIGVNDPPDDEPMNRSKALLKLVETGLEEVDESLLTVVEQGEELAENDDGVL